MARKFKQVSADFTKLDKKGDTAEGTILDILTVQIKDKTRPVVVLQTDDERILKVPLTDSAAPDLAAFGKGEYIRITLKDLVNTGKGNPAKVFKFERGVE